MIFAVSYLRIPLITVKSSTCDISINWGPPSRDVELISEYEIFLQEYRSGWRSLDKILVGNMTHYTTPCSFESGRLYQFFIRSKINLRGPMQEMFVDTSYTSDILGKKLSLTFEICSNCLRVFCLYFNILFRYSCSNFYISTDFFWFLILGVAVSLTFNLR